MAMFSTFNAFASGSGLLPNRSLAFNGSSSTLSMSGTNFGAFNQAKWAWSGWVRSSNAIQTASFFNQKATGGASSQLGFRPGIGGVQSIYFFGTTSDGSGLDSQFLTDSDYSSTSVFYHVLFWYDSANSTPANRIKMWVNGVQQTSNNYGQTNPTGPIGSLGTVSLGGNTVDSFNFFNGYVYQPSFFSGTLPDISTVYNNGHPAVVAGLPGLWSLLNTTDIAPLTQDFILPAAWTNNNGVTASTTIPT